ncbi:MAG: hypothetical protein Q8O30_01235 [Candidatus Omnitrophota bacterium]|nr:hypothetical protein [Candidatus Omnitrophota bacterium]
MKRVVLFSICLALAMLNVGCQNTKTRVVEGAVIGGLLGGAAGGIIGHQSGHGGEGAGIGVAAGAITGAIVGSQIKKPEVQTQEQTQIQETKVTEQSKTDEFKPLSMQQIVELKKQGFSDEEIIKKIKATNSKFSLTKDGIDYLKQQGISQRIIEAMQGK